MCFIKHLGTTTENNFFLGTIGTEETFGKTFLFIAMDKDQNSMASLFPVSLEILRDQGKLPTCRLKQNRIMHKTAKRNVMD